METVPWAEICKELSKTVGGTVVTQSLKPLGGGGRCQAVCVSNGERNVMLKVSSQGRSGMFEAEAAGLEELSRANAIRVPVVYGLGKSDSWEWIAMEYISMTPPTPRGQQRLGEGLARLHRRKRDRFGWDRDNTIGLTPQRNSFHASWVGFLKEERLAYQFELAARQGMVFDGHTELLDQVEHFFSDYNPQPSLLHGDLWSGNVGFAREGEEPIIYDPAVYFGDREAEFGIIEMFGGFSRRFFAAYQSEYPLEEGFEKRRDLYLLYHQLNHFNLFGSSYVPAVQSTLQRLIASLN